MQRNESEVEGMAVASVVGDDSTNPASPNPDDNEGHKEASGKKKKNRCLSCKKKVGLTGNEMQTLVGFGVRSALSDLFFLECKRRESLETLHSS